MARGSLAYDLDRIREYLVKQNIYAERAAVLAPGTPSTPPALMRR